MDVILSKEGIDLQECDILVTGFFQDERPLQGSSGWVDWRLNGLLSRFLIANKLTGEWKETTLIPSQERMIPRMILLVGLGRASEYSYLRLRELCPYLSDILRKLDTSKVCLSFPWKEDYHVDCGKLIEVLLEGMADTVNLHESPPGGVWIKRLSLFFAEGEEQLPEMLLGVQTAKMVLGERFDIRIFAPSETVSEEQNT